MVATASKSIVQCNCNVTRVQTAALCSLLKLVQCKEATFLQVIMLHVVLYSMQTVHCGFVLIVATRLLHHFFNTTIVADPCYNYYCGHKSPQMLSGVLLLPSIACASIPQYELVTVYLDNSSYHYKYGVSDLHKGLAVGCVCAWLM